LRLWVTAAAVVLGAGCAAPAARVAPGPARASGPGSAPAAAVPAAAPPLRPAARGARVYAAFASSADRALVPADPLRAAIVGDARTRAKRAGAPLPDGDARLDLAMNDLATNLRGEDLPALEVVDFLLAHYGIAEPSPHLLMSRASAGADRQIREYAAREIADVGKSSPIARIGVGIDRQPDALYVVIALQERHLELGSVPRQLPSGGAASIAAKIEPRYRNPELVITAPDGKVSEQHAPAAPPGSVPAAFEGHLRCAGDGRYQVEINADDSFGTAVLANFPVFCGADPPAAAPRSAGVRPGGVDAAAAEKEMLELVNRDRRAAGLPPVALDARLGAVARAHSQEMAADDNVFHVSPRTGSALDRVHRAGLTPELVLENVGRAYSADEAERGFLASPGHRGNIVEPRASRLGVGIAFGKPVTGTSPMFVTQLFTN
jgi:uncharacterized protein YkwD